MFDFFVSSVLGCLISNEPNGRSILFSVTVNMSQSFTDKTQTDLVKLITDSFDLLSGLDTTTAWVKPNFSSSESDSITEYRIRRR